MATKKVYTTQRVAGVKALSERMAPGSTKLLLTGTPTRNGRPKEFMAQLDVIDRLEDFGGAWKFLQRYCAPTDNGFGMDFNGSSNEDEFNERLRALCYVRREKAQVLKELPPKDYETVWLDGDIKGYRKAEAKFAAIARDRKGGHLVALGGLRQAAAKAKMKATIEWGQTFLRETDRKLILACWHRDVSLALSAEFNAPHIIGGDSDEAKDAAVQSFQNDPETRVIVVNIQAGGTGLTLTAASDVAFVEQPWTPADFDQMADRVHRIGQLSDTVNIWTLALEDSIDEDMVETIGDKRDRARVLTSGVDADDQSVEANRRRDEAQKVLAQSVESEVMERVLARNMEAA